MFGFGFARVLREFRTGDPLAIALGGLALLVAWWRRPQKRELLHAEELEMGEEFVVQLKPRKTE